MNGIKSIVFACALAALITMPDHRSQPSGPIATGESRSGEREGNAQRCRT